jgi:hypothetical protein
MKFVQCEPKVHRLQAGRFLIAILNDPRLSTLNQRVSSEVGTTYGSGWVS